MANSIGQRLEQYTIKRPQEVLLVTTETGGGTRPNCYFQGLFQLFNPSYLLRSRCACTLRRCPDYLHRSGRQSLQSRCASLYSARTELGGDAGTIVPDGDLTSSNLHLTVSIKHINFTETLHQYLSLSVMYLQ